MKNILITGASGFIGNFLVDEAVSRCYKVYAAVRKSSKIDSLIAKGVEIVTLDLSNTSALVDQLQALPPLHYVIHNAGVTKANKDDDYFEINQKYTKNFVDALSELPTIPQKILYVSSLAAFGPGKPDCSDPILLSDTPNPVTKYGESKLMGEMVVRGQKSIPYLVLRPTAVYGPGERDILINFKIINKGFEFFIGSQPQNLTFIYVKDLVVATFNLLESVVVDKCYFISDGRVYSKKEMGEVVAKALNKSVFRISVPLLLVKIIAFISEKIGKLQGKGTALNLPKVKELEATNWVCDITDLQNDISFSPLYTLQTGLPETIEWYKNEGWIK